MTTTSHMGGAETGRTTREVLDQYNEAFRLHDPAFLDDLIADDCIIEDTGPAPDGLLREGGQACLARWSEPLLGLDSLPSPDRAKNIQSDY